MDIWKFSLGRHFPVNFRPPPTSPGEIEGLTNRAVLGEDSILSFISTLFPTLNFKSGDCYLRSTCSIFELLFGVRTSIHAAALSLNVYVCTKFIQWRENRKGASQTFKKIVKLEHME